MNIIENYLSFGPSNKGSLAFEFVGDDKFPTKYVIISADGMKESTVRKGTCEGFAIYHGIVIKKV